MAGHINRISATKPQGRWITNDKEHSYRLYSDFSSHRRYDFFIRTPQGPALGRVAFVGGRTALCWRTAFVMAVLHCAGRAAKPKPEGYTPAMQLVTPRAVAMAVRIEMAV